MAPETRPSISGFEKLPNDWQLENAESLCSKITKGTTPPKSEITTERKIPFIRVNNLSSEGGIGVKPPLIFVTGRAHKKELARSIAFPGDILMNIVGPPLGQTAILNHEFFEFNMNQAVLVYRVNTEKVDREYFYAYLRSEVGQQWLQSRAKKTSGQQNLTIALCKELPVPIPPVKEQNKIAKILLVWDQAIATTEKMFENSQQLRKALMQQLLSGSERQDRLSSNWQYKPLSQLCKISKGTQLNRNTLSDGHAYPVINGGILPSGYTPNFNTEGNTITISEGGNSCGFVSFQKNKFWCGGHCYAILEPKLSREFLYQLLKFHESKIMRLRVGSGLPNIQKADLCDLNLHFPSNVVEQQKIAEILNTADREVETLDAKLTCLKQEKKALMQQLLTGKRRVKVDGLRSHHE